jgi:uncharacterized membrane protein
MSTVLFLTLRVVHVLLAAVWIGATVFMSLLLMPAIEAAGPAGGQIMIGLNRKGMAAFFGATGGITLLTGIYLFWRFTGGFDPEISRSHAGMAFSIGGLAGLLAVVIGGAVVSRSSKKVIGLMEQAAKLPDTQRGALMQEAGVLRQRMKTFGSLVIVFQFIALALMAVGHYI